MQFDNLSTDLFAEERIRISILFFDVESLKIVMFNSKMKKFEEFHMQRKNKYYELLIFFYFF